MKVIIFLSRVAFICNLFFVAAVILRYVEIEKTATGSTTGILGHQWLTSTTVILGYSAIFLNMILFFAYLLVMFRNNATGRRVPKWLFIANMLFFGAQIYYFLL
jgi:hypothetical protein